MPDLTPHAQRNARAWDATSDAYQDRHGPQLDKSGGLAWGCWQIPEDRLGVLGDVAGKDILELGCGAAQWSIALAALGARPVGLDVSARQLAHARELMVRGGVEFPLVEGSAEAVPLPDAGFDIVFCDYGAMTFCDPALTVPEASRLLRPGGLLAFSTASPIQELSWSGEDEEPTDRFVRSYFGMREIDEEDMVSFSIPFGQWIELFRANGFNIERLLELEPPEHNDSTYRTDRHHAWARRWPADMIWVVRRV